MKISRLKMYKCIVCGTEVKSENDNGNIQICSGCY